MKKLIFLSCLLLGLSEVIRAEDNENVTFIGLDEMGKEINIPMKKRLWSKRYQEVLKRLGGESLAGLGSLLPSGEKFDFFEFNLGAEVRMQVGIGDLVSATIQPYFHLIFKK